MKLSDHIDEIKNNLLKLTIDKQIILEQYDKYNKLYELECDREKIDYASLFENIKNLDIYKLCCDNNKEYIQNTKLEYIKNQIIRIEELKTCKYFYELESYRCKYNLEKITTEYDNIYMIKSKLIIDQFNDD